MPISRCILLTIAIAVAGASDAYSLDFSKTTCANFMASGHPNMAAIFMFLRGYHSGKTGVISFDNEDQYPARLGTYCKQHPDAGLIEASEQILSELKAVPSPK